jgi:hypothetical protein
MLEEYDELLAKARDEQDMMEINNSKMSNDYNVLRQNASELFSEMTWH